MDFNHLLVDGQVIKFDNSTTLVNGFHKIPQDYTVFLSERAILQSFEDYGNNFICVLLVFEFNALLTISAMYAVLIIHDNEHVNYRQ